MRPLSLALAIMAIGAPCHLAAHAQVITSPTYVQPRPASFQPQQGASGSGVQWPQPAPVNAFPAESLPPPPTNHSAPHSVLPHGTPPSNIVGPPPTCADCGVAGLASWRAMPHWLLGRGGSCNCGGPNVGGWIQLGHHQFPTPLSVTRGDLAAMNDVPRQYNLHQLWLFVEDRAQHNCCSWDFGYRMDIVYGTDAQKTQSFGNENASKPNQGKFDASLDNGVYGWAIPQMYLEASIDNFSVILGHFYSLMGYESVMAPDNFFYSHSLTMFNSEPFTHTGVMTSYNLHPRLQAFAGLTLGWNTGFDQFRNGFSYLGGVSYSLCDQINMNYFISFGDFGQRGADAYAQSIVVDILLKRNLTYVIQSDLVAIGSQAAGTFNDQIGINQYLIYRCCHQLGFGGRLEWWKSDGVSHYEATIGMNYKPRPNIVIRPELRYDWKGLLVRNGVVGGDQTTFAIDAVFTH